MTGWIAATALAALAAVGGAAFFAGARWQSARDRSDQLAETKAVVAKAQQQLVDYGTALHASNVQFQRDADALRGIAEDYANGNRERQRAAAALDSRLEAYLATRPERPDCDLDAAGLRLWNAANRGPAADSADGSGDAAPGGEGRSVPAGGLPGPAASRGRPAGDAAAEPSAGGRLVLRLSGAAGRAGAVGAVAGAAGNPAADGARRQTELSAATPGGAL